MTLVIRHSPELQQHLETFEVDGATVAAVLFDGGRLSYPGRKEIEYQLGHTEPYTLELESRTIEGLSSRAMAATRIMAQIAGEQAEDPTLDFLWTAHSSWASREISLDRLVAALVGVQLAIDGGHGPEAEYAAQILVWELASMGFFPSSESLEEICDGAPPACVGLGLVDIDWR
jgi:hypothetical protein